MVLPSVEGTALLGSRSCTYYLCSHCLGQNCGHPATRNSLHLSIPLPRQIPVSFIMEEKRMDIEGQLSGSATMEGERQISGSGLL